MLRTAAILVVSLVAIVALGDTGRPLSDLNLRRAPTTRKPNVITVLRTSDELEILETRRGWHRVRVVETGVEGWVAQKYVRLIPRESTQTTDGVPEGAEGESAASGRNVAIIAGLLAVIGYATGYKRAPAAGNAVPNRPPPNRVAAFVLSFTLGALYVVLTLPTLLSTVGTERGWTAVAQIGDWGMAFNQQLSDVLPLFPALLRCVWWGTLFYLGSLLLLALRHASAHLFWLGTATLSASIAVFHLVCWAGYVIVKVLAMVFWVISAIFRLLHSVFGGILSFLMELVATVVIWIYDWSSALLGQFWWLALAGVVIAGAAVLVKGRPDARAVSKLMAQLVVAATVVTAVLYALRWLWNLISSSVLSVLRFLGGLVVMFANVLLRVLSALGILLAVAMIGQLLLDQIRSALAAGRGRRGVVIGALAIGTSIAILLLVSNIYGVAGWLPSSVAAIAGHYLYQPAPLLDAIIAFCIVSLGVTGVWRNMPALGEEPTLRDFNESLVYSFVGTIFAGGFAALGGAQAED